MKTTIPIIILVVFAWACSSTEYIDWGDKGERIVMSGQWCDRDTTHRLYVGIVDKTGIRRLDEAQVSVTINGESVPSVFIPYDMYTQPEWRSSCFSFEHVFSPDDDAATSRLVYLLHFLFVIDDKAAAGEVRTLQSCGNIMLRILHHGDSRLAYLPQVEGADIARH